MAEGNDFLKDFEDLERLISCSICEEILTEPKLFPNCLHVFCFECIQGWARRCEKDRKSLNCPSCRASINLQIDTTKLQTSFHHNSLIQLYKNSEFYKKKGQQEFDDAKAAVSDKNASLIEMLDCCMTTVEQTDENMQRIEEEIVQAVNEVRRNTLLQIKILQKHEQAKLRKLKIIRMKRKAEHEEIKRKMTNDIREILELNSSCEKFEHICIEQFDREDFQQLLDSCKVVIERTKSTVSADQVHCKSSILYRPNTEVVTVLESLKIGEINIDMTDASQCTIECIQPAKCGFVNRFSIITRDSKGGLCNTNKALLDVCIQDLNGWHIENDIVESNNGNFTVTFIANRPSQYNVAVSIGGKAIQNSPQQINVTHDTTEFRPVTFFHATKASHPQALAINGQGDIAIVNNDERNDCRIVIYNAAGEYMRDFGGEATGEDRLRNPLGLVYTPTDEHLLVTDHTSDGACIKQYHIDGRLLRFVYKQNGVYFTRICATQQGYACLSYNKQSQETSLKLFSKETYDWLEDVSLDAPVVKALPLSLACDNNKYFVSYNNVNKVYVFDENGSLLYTIGNERFFDHPCGLAAFGVDMLLVCDGGNHCVQLLHQNGLLYIGTFGSHGSGLGQMLWPADIFVTQDGKVFVVDCSNKCIQVFR